MEASLRGCRRLSKPFKSYSLEISSDLAQYRLVNRLLLSHAKRKITLRIHLARGDHRTQEKSLGSDEPQKLSFVVAHLLFSSALSAGRTLHELPYHSLGAHSPLGSFSISPLSFIRCNVGNTV